MAQNDGSECNTEFFFTLDATPELQNKHTIFAKVSGETIYNLLKLNESPTDSNDRPLYPHKINKVKILHNPFEDLVPNIDSKKSSKEERTEPKKKKQEGVKNFKLISFGDEAEKDEQEVESFPKEVAKEPIKSNSFCSSSKTAKIMEEKPWTVKPQQEASKVISEQNEESDSDYESTIEKEKLLELERKRKEIQDQIKDVKKQYQKGQKEKAEQKETETAKIEERKEDGVIRDYLDEKEKYKQKKLNVKGKTREDFTLSLLAKFKNKLHSAIDSEIIPAEGQSAQNSDDENWLSHKLDFSESEAAVLAKDASKKQDDWYDIYDPRNPLNKRKRGAEKSTDSLIKMKK